MFTANVTASGDILVAMATLLRRAAPDGSSIAMAATLRDLASVSFKTLLDSRPLHMLRCLPQAQSAPCSPGLRLRTSGFKRLRRAAL